MMTQWIGILAALPARFLVPQTGYILKQNFSTTLTEPLRTARMEHPRDEAHQDDLQVIFVIINNHIPVAKISRVPSLRP